MAALEPVVTGPDGASGAISVGLADDEPLFTAGLALMLDAQPGLRVSWQAIDGADALRRCAVDEPDVLLLDIRMPGMDGLEATRRLVAGGTRCRILVLTTFSEDEYVLTAVEAGAAGFLLKNTPPADLIEAIHTVHRGDAVLSPEPTRRLFAAFRSQERRPSPSRDDLDVLRRLTGRERDVLELVARGLTNGEICKRLWLSMPTVKTHVGNLMAKTHARDRVQLVLFALRTGVAPL
ncbi:MAG: response regulator transcription factor [Micropruina sp.]